MGQRDRAQWISGRICCPEQTDCTRNRRPDAGSAPSHAQRKASRPDAIVGRRSSFLILENLLDVVALPFTSRPLTRSLSLGATAHCHSPIDPGVDVSYECSAFFPTSSFTPLHDSHDRRFECVRPHQAARLLRAHLGTSNSLVGSSAATEAPCTSYSSRSHSCPLETLQQAPPPRSSASGTKGPDTPCATRGRNGLADTKGANERSTCLAFETERRLASDAADAPCARAAPCFGIQRTPARHTRPPLIARVYFSR